MEMQQDWKKSFFTMHFNGAAWHNGIVQTLFSSGMLMLIVGFFCYSSTRKFDEAISR